MYNLNEIVFSITRAVDGINPKFNYHSRMVAYTALTISKRLNKSILELEDVLLASLLHDIGVVSLKQREISIFLESIPKVYFDHEKKGEEILAKYGYLSHLAKTIKYHHLSWNKISEVKDDIPLLSHIIHVADRVAVNFAINCKNCYEIKNAKQNIIDFLKKNKGKNFSPELVDLILDDIAGYEEFWANLFFIADLDFKDIEREFFIKPKYIDVAGLKKIVPFFGEIIDSHSSFTKCHSIFVANIAYYFSDILGLSEHEKNLMCISGYLHDLGKIYVPKEILDKPGTLTKKERDIVILHPYFTRKILSSITDFDEIADIASSHHERIDGSGYPRGLKNDEISFFSRILMICDIMASFLESRPYRNALTLNDTFKVLFEFAYDKKIDLSLLKKMYDKRSDLKNLLHLISENYFCEVS